MSLDLIESHADFLPMAVETVAFRIIVACTECVQRPHVPTCADLARVRDFEG